ncbi:MAG: hypothetical protein P8080_04760 [Gammaproteobacteria bacterium]
MDTNAPGFAGDRGKPISLGAALGPGAGNGAARGNVGAGIILGLAIAVRIGAGRHRPEPGQ